MDEQLRQFIKLKSQEIIIQKQPKINQCILDTLQYAMLTKLSIIIQNQSMIDINTLLNSYIIPINDDLYLVNKGEPNHQPNLQIWLACQTIEYIGMDYISLEQPKRFIKCSPGCMILVIKENLISNLLNQYYRITEESTLQALQKIYFIQNMSQNFFCALIQQSQRQSYIKGQKIYNTGDAVDRFCLLLQGEVSIKTNVNIQQIACTDNDTVTLSKQIWAKFGKKIVQKYQELVIKTITSGQCFGEVELFSELSFRQQFAQCNSLQCEVLIIRLEVLMRELRLFTKNPNITLGELSDRNQKHVNLKSTHSILREQKSTKILNDFASQNSIIYWPGKQGPIKQISGSPLKLSRRTSLTYIQSQTQVVQPEPIEEKEEFTLDFKKLRFHPDDVSKAKFVPSKERPSTEMQKIHRSQSTMISQSPQRPLLFVHQHHLKFSKFQHGQKHEITLKSYLDKLTIPEYKPHRFKSQMHIQTQGTTSPIRTQNSVYEQQRINFDSQMLTPLDQMRVRSRNQSQHQISVVNLKL